MTDPSRIFEVSGEVCPLKCKALSIAVSTNATAVGAITGRKIRVMGFIAQGDGGVTKITFKDGSGGASLLAPITVASSATPGQLIVGLTNQGYFETSTGVGLFIDVATTAVNLSVFYIDYVP